MTRLELFTLAGAGFATALALFWLVVAARTLHGAWTTRLFVSPCRKGAAMPVRFEADIA